MIKSHFPIAKSYRQLRTHQYGHHYCFNELKLITSPTLSSTPSTSLPSSLSLPSLLLSTSSSLSFSSSSSSSSKLLFSTFIGKKMNVLDLNKETPKMMIGFDVGLKKVYTREYSSNAESTDHSDKSDNKNLKMKRKAKKEKIHDKETKTKYEDFNHPHLYLPLIISPFQKATQYNLKTFTKNLKFYFIGNNATAIFISKKLLKENDARFVFYGSYDQLKIIYNAIKKCISRLIERNNASKEKLKKQIENTQNVKKETRNVESKANTSHSNKSKLDQYFERKREKYFVNKLLNRIYVVGKFERDLNDMDQNDAQEQGNIHLSGKPIHLSLLPKLIRRSLDAYGASEKKNWKGVFIPCYTFLNGLKSIDSNMKHGITIRALNDQKIFPDFGVPLPSRNQIYINLLQRVFHEYYTKQEIENELCNGLEINVGTGVLSFLLKQEGVKQVMGTDSNRWAIECAKRNAMHLGVADVVRFQYADMFPTDENIPDEKFDIIVCKPCLVKAYDDTLDDDAILFDMESQFLHVFLSNVHKYLSNKPCSAAFLLCGDDTESPLLAEHCVEMITDMAARYNLKLKLEHAILDKKGQHQKEGEKEAEQVENKVYCFVLSRNLQ